MSSSNLVKLFTALESSKFLIILCCNSIPYKNWKTSCVNYRWKLSLNCSRVFAVWIYHIFLPFHSIPQNVHQFVWFDALKNINSYSIPSVKEIYCKAITPWNSNLKSPSIFGSTTSRRFWSEVFAKQSIDNVDMSDTSVNYDTLICVSVWERLSGMYGTHHFLVYNYWSDFLSSKLLITVIQDKPNKCINIYMI